LVKPAKGTGEVEIFSGCAVIKPCSDIFIVPLKLFKMKKVLLSALLAVSAAGNLQAQVFQYLYGTANADLLTDGHTTNLGGLNGHFLVAPSQTTTAPFLFSATRTNNNGVAIPAGIPYFNNLYRLSDVPNPPGAPNLRVQEVRSVQINNGNAYGLAGSYVRGSGAPGLGVFYQQINPMGALVPLFGPGTTAGYFFNGPATTYSDVHVRKIINSTQVPGDMYILGTLTEALGGYSRIFVLRINQAGGLIWSFVYRLDFSSVTNTDFPYDIVESVQPRAGVFELMVVGEHFAAAAGTSDGFLMRINSNVGTIINPVQFYGTTAVNEGFTCIKTSANAAVDPAGAGYVIGGYANNGTNAAPLLDYWFLAVNQAGAVSWSNTFDYVSTTALTNKRCNDLIERQINPGVFDYYLAGTVDMGVFGAQDMMVIHANQFGNGLPLGQFTYGTQNAQRCIRIDQSNVPGTAVGGISMYGSSFRIPQPPPPLGNFDLYLVKAGFNGATACDYNLLDPKQKPGPKLLMTKSSDHTNKFYQYIMYSNSVTVMNEYNICSAITAPVTPGSTAKALPLTAEDIQVSPNPTSGNVDLLTTSGWENGSVVVLNAVGQEMVRMQIDASGKTLINMSQFPAGMYLLRAEANGQSVVKKVMKQ
jgi:hypothetical protein